jgi:hypothetical protein
MTADRTPEKFLEWTFPDGSTWRVPARVVAESRARYYAEKDPDTTYDEEFAYTLGDDYEISDWFFNNMNPEDVLHHAVRVKPPIPLSFTDGVRHDGAQCVVISEAP